MPDPHFANTPAYFKEVSTGTTPSSGQVALYAKTDGLLYSKDDAGTELPLGGGGGSGAYLPLSGGTLTGPLVGTTATFPTATIAGMFLAGSFSGLWFNYGWWSNGSDIRFGDTGRLTFASGSAPGNAADTILLRDAANTLALRNGTNPQAFNTYNTSTSGNLTYERGFTRWSSNVFQIGTEKLGQGVARPIDFVVGGAVAMNINTSGVVQVPTGNVFGGGGYRVTIGGHARMTGTTQSLQFITTGEIGSVYFMNNSGFYTEANATFPLGLSNRRWSQLFLGPTGIRIGDGTNGPTISASGTSPNESLVISPAGTGTLELRNGTNPQAFNTYNTSTSANLTYERGFTRWSSNVFQIGTEKLGAGVARPMGLVTDGVERWNISTAGHLLATADNTYDIGALGASRPRNAFFSGSIRFDQTSVGYRLRLNVGLDLGSSDEVNMSGPGAGILRLIDGATGTFFHRINLGNATSAFPAIKRSGTTLQARLADDSAFTGFSCGALTTNGPTTETQYDIGNSGASITISLANGTFQRVTLTGNCTFTMPTALAGQSFTLQVLTGAGSFTAAFTNVRWSGGVSPVITAAASRMDIASFISDGTNWYGNINANYTV